MTDGNDEQAEYYAHTNMNSTLFGEAGTSLFGQDARGQELRSRLSDDEAEIIEDAAYSGNAETKLQQLGGTNAGAVVGR